jgi:dipeptidyl aminopeptidase/acylaminoacyl peptidase
LPPAGGEPVRLTNTDGNYFCPSWSPDGQMLALLGRQLIAGANATLHLLPRTGGTPQRVDPGFDRQSGVTGNLSAPEAPKWLDSSTLLTAAEDRGDMSLLLARIDQPTTWLARRRRQVAAHSATVGNPRVAFLASTPCTPVELFVLDLATGDERQLTTFNAAWRSAKTLSAPERIVVETAPGVEIDVWWMKPAGFTEGKTYPVLLNVHGGPFTQYSESFFDEFHVYTGAGYGVVYCNPRGSSGQSTAFGRSIIGNLGVDDFHDVMAAFDAALAKMPWADRGRLGIMGGSYGGFMTSWVIGHDQRFAAAVSERAVNCWYTMQGTSDIGSWFNESYLGEGAAIESDMAALLRQSPLTYAKQIAAPVLILHSEDDLRCPISQGEQLFVVLKRLGKDVEFVRSPMKITNCRGAANPVTASIGSQSSSITSPGSCSRRPDVPTLGYHGSSRLARVFRTADVFTSGSSRSTSVTISSTRPCSDLAASPGASDHSSSSRSARRGGAIASVAIKERARLN